MKITIILSLSLLFMFIAFFLYSSRPDIEGKEAKQLVKEGAFLLDVRSRGEFNSGHIATAILIPVGDIKSQQGKLPKKSRAIVVYCRSGIRSARAARILKSEGFTKVHNLGSLNNWPKE